MPNIELPYKWNPRPYQKEQFIQKNEGCNRMYKVWHRRAGKDVTDINFTATQVMQRKGLYWHLLPTFNQARKAIWQGMTKDGRPFIDFFPPEIIKAVHQQDMRIEFINGSIWQIVGSDKIDTLVGSNPIGVVFSEYALTNPRSWPLIEPILQENDGWAVFNTTPRGHNHAFELAEKAKFSENWWYDVKTITDTGVITPEQVIKMKNDGTANEVIQQEYYCSFEAPLVGSYYAEQMNDLESKGQLTTVPYDPRFEVHTWWDIGVSDYTSIWFAQYVGREIRLIDFMQANGKGPDHYVKELKAKDYNYGVHNLPHDANYSQFTLGGRSVYDQFTEMWPGTSFRVHPVTKNVATDIYATRTLLPRCVFDSKSCYEGIQALKNYQQKYNEKAKTFGGPLHDWSSHAADAMRYLAVGYREHMGEEVPDESNPSGLPTFNQLMEKDYAPESRQRI